MSNYRKIERNVILVVVTEPAREWIRLQCIYIYNPQRVSFVGIVILKLFFFFLYLLVNIYTVIISFTFRTDK